MINYSVNEISGKYTCDVPPQIISDRILVPVRAISESAGCNVAWNSDNKTVVITK
ncbi:MAG: stalk domain-containing protein [Candidatus Ornithomonoglobus sp.]